MKRTTIALALATGLAFALTACGDNDAEEAEVAPAATDTVAAVEDFDPTTRDFALSEAAQARRAEFDVDAFQSEYRGYRDELAGSGEDPSGAAAEATDAGATATGGTAGGIPERGSMSWSYLDRNGDNRLSVAEYAIWAIPLDPTEPKPNDQAPYVTADQANRAADSFFYYDTDGDTYLSQSEFTIARQGRTI